MDDKKQIIDAAFEHFGATLIDIEAQEYAKGFYEGVGVKTIIRHLYARRYSTYQDDLEEMNV